MPGLSPFFHQKPPFEYDVLGQRKNSLFEQGPDLLREPVGKIRSPTHVGE